MTDTRDLKTPSPFPYISPVSDSYTATPEATPDRPTSTENINA